MIAIADSGSTKTDWCVLKDDGTEVRFLTEGLNPYHHTSGHILRKLSASEQVNALRSGVKRVHFYGAGCSSEELNAVVEQALASTFENAQITVGHDMLGAAISIFGKGPGIACILGTGSNSCLFDGERTSERLPSLGYVLGDEGSGAWFGKRLVIDHLYNRPMNDALKAELVSQGFSQQRILERVYKEPGANVFLASFMPLLHAFRNTLYVSELLETGFAEFLHVHVNCFPEAKGLSVGFVGSVAHFFEEELRSALSKTGLQPGPFIQRPLDGLVGFHMAEK